MDVIINSDAISMPEGSALVANFGQYYANLLVCLGYCENAPPVADLLRRYHGLDGQWLVISPIYWQATHNDAMIVACDQALQLSEHESMCWFDALADFLKHDPIKLHYHDAYTWLIQRNEYAPIQSLPVQALLQQSMMSHLQSLDTTLFWQRFITENQMFFSEHLLNQSRAAIYPINGVWIWGGGQLKKQGFTPIVYEDEKGKALANLLSTKARPYHPKEHYTNDTVLLLSALNNDTPHQLEKNTARWYWNNMAYVSKRKSWWRKWL